MKKYLLTLLLLAFAIVSVSAQPKLEMSKESVDWGSVKSTAGSLSTKITLTNSGSKVLDIIEIRKSPGVRINKNRLSLNPGEQFTLDVEVKVPSRQGKLIKTLSFVTNEKTKSKLRKFIQLRAFIETPLIVTPNMLTLQAGSPDMPFGKIKIKNTTKESISISNFDASSKNIFVKVPGGAVVPPGSEIEIEVRLLPLESQSGAEKKSYIRFSSSHNAQNMIEIPVVLRGM